MDIRNGQTIAARPALTTINASVDRYVYTDAAPNMDNLNAARTPDLAGHSAFWVFDVSYRRNQREDMDRFSDNGGFFVGDVNIATRMGNHMRGGLGAISYRYRIGNVALPETLVYFHVRGTNPTPAAVEAFVNGIPNRPWYLLPIARHESGTPAASTEFRQFNPGAGVGPQWNDYIRCPNFGAPNGWGIMQLDNPPASALELWHWQANVTEGRARLVTLRDACAGWLQDQIRQQMEERADLPLANESWSFDGGVTFQEETARTPLDLLTIKRYNGGYILHWENPDFEAGRTGRWVVKDTGRAYVNSVCRRINQ